MKHLSLFAISLIVGVGLNAQPTPQVKPNPFQIDSEWKNWKQKYASASPLLSLNKTWPKAIEITDENLNLVLQRKSEVKFKEALSLGDRKFTSFDVVESDDAVRFEAYDQIDEQQPIGANALQIPKEEDRFGILVGHMQNLIEKRKTDELLILWTGATHGIDLYFDFFLKDSDKAKLKPILQHRGEIVWAAAPLKLETPYFSREFYQLKEKVDGIPSKPVTFGSASVVHAVGFLSRLYFYQNLVRERLKLADLKHDEAKLGTIVILDIPRAEEDAHILNLPSARSLKAAGIKSIKVGVEAWKYGTTYTLEDLRKLSVTPLGIRFQDYEVQLLKENHPQWYKRYMDGVVVDQAVHALYKKLQSWADTGMNLNITGLED